MNIFTRKLVTAVTAAALIITPLQAEASSFGLSSSNSKGKNVIENINPPEPSPETGVENYDGIHASEIEILNMINQYRAENGIAPIASTPQYYESAEQWVHYLDETDQFYHDPSKNIFENLALNYTSPMKAVEQWKNSPGHNKNMLDSDMTVGGVAIKYDESRRAYIVALQGFYY